MENISKTREELTRMFLDSLKEEKLPWRKGWITQGIPKNHSSNKDYQGINRFLLMLVSEFEGYRDNRWMTFKQIQDKDYKLVKGAKGIPIEYWSIYDSELRKNITFDEANKLRKPYDDKLNEYIKNQQTGLIEKQSNYIKSRWKVVNRTSYVFNGEKIEGLPKLQEKEEMDLTNKEYKQFFNKFLENTNLKINHNGERAFYNPTMDFINLPNVETFKSEYDYYATGLHECSHATLHESRLNRNVMGTFGDTSYAIEELRAEISSAFLLSEIGLSGDIEEMNNHKAYIQSWAEVIQNDSSILFDAIKDANGICDYILENGEWSSILSNLKHQIESIEENVSDLKEDINHLFGETSIDVKHNFKDRIKQAKDVLNNSTNDIKQIDKTKENER